MISRINGRPAASVTPGILPISADEAMRSAHDQADPDEHGTEREDPPSQSIDAR